MVSLFEAVLFLSCCGYISESYLSAKKVPKFFFMLIVAIFMFLIALGFEFSEYDHIIVSLVILIYLSFLYKKIIVISYFVMVFCVYFTLRFFVIDHNVAGITIVILCILIPSILGMIFFFINKIFMEELKDH